MISSSLGVVLTLAALADNVRGRDPDIDPEVLRLVIQYCDDFGRLPDDVSREGSLAEPPLTGDGRPDAFFAGPAVHLVRVSGMASAPA